MKEKQDWRSSRQLLNSNADPDVLAEIEYQVTESIKKYAPRASVSRKKRELRLTPGGEIENLFSSGQVIGSAHGEALRQRYKVIFADYLEKKICGTYLSCVNEFVADDYYADEPPPSNLSRELTQYGSMMGWKYLIFVKFWYRRLYSLFKSINNFKITADGTAKSDEDYLITKEEDKKRLDWEPVLTLLRDCINSSGSLQNNTINQLNENLERIAEGMWGDKAEESLRILLKSIEFPEVKETPDSLFKYDLDKKVTEKIAEKDEGMFDALKKDLFQGFGDISTKENKAIKSTISATAVPNGTGFFTLATQSNANYQVTQRPCLDSTSQNPVTDSSVGWLGVGTALGFIAGVGLTYAVGWVKRKYWPGVRSVIALEKAEGESEGSRLRRPC